MSRKKTPLKDEQLSPMENLKEDLGAINAAIDSLAEAVRKKAPCAPVDVSAIREAMRGVFKSDYESWMAERHQLAVNQELKYAKEHGVKMMTSTEVACKINEQNQDVIKKHKAVCDDFTALKSKFEALKQEYDENVERNRRIDETLPHIMAALGTGEQEKHPFPRPPRKVKELKDYFLHTLAPYIYDWGARNTQWLTKLALLCTFLMFLLSNCMIGFILYDKAQVEKENEKNQLIRLIICHNKEIKADVLYIDGLYADEKKHGWEIKNLWSRYGPKSETEKFLEKQIERYEKMQKSADRK